MRRATHALAQRKLRQRISIHALRAEGDGNRITIKGVRNEISIHALRAEGDALVLGSNSMRGISIHALRAEGDFGDMEEFRAIVKFLSTPSVRRATRQW